MHVCMYVSMYVCMYVNITIYTFTYAYVNMMLHAYIYIYKYTYDADIQFSLQPIAFFHPRNPALAAPRATASRVLGVSGGSTCSTSHLHFLR